jgi:hypothetical protein
VAVIASTPEDGVRRVAAAGQAGPAAGAARQGRLDQRLAGRPVPGEQQRRPQQGGAPLGDEPADGRIDVTAHRIPPPHPDRVRREAVARFTCRPSPAWPSARGAARRGRLLRSHAGGATRRARAGPQQVVEMPPSTGITAPVT